MQKKTGEEPQWTILKVLHWTTSYFKSHDIENPRVDAEILLAHVLESERIDLYTRFDLPLSQNELADFKSLIKRRISREPVAYIVGEKGFWSLDIEVTGDVLIPRPETECLVEEAVGLLPAGQGGKRVLEVGTGSGAIILALASERPDNLFFASDHSVRAVELARKNAVRCGLAESVCFFSGNWFLPLKSDSPRFDMVLSNPPYIRTGVIGQLQPEIFKYEPLMALDGGKDGLDCISYIIRSAPFYLNRGGHLLLEIGHDQKDAVQEIIRDCGRYEHVCFIKDYGGHDRVVRMVKRET
ncbi:peptide chain release factor N(5)-glutamine methyltransferase [Desulfococcaceae bacterium HSG8]|nr:peptide chain release factor N(5)-glutamine methyltransferase [Desulfococcaceae bacterium HSG8]